MSIWDDIADTPREAESLRLRSELMLAIEKRISGEGWPQAAVGRKLGLTESRVSELLQGKISKFPLDVLVGIGAELGIRLKVAECDRPLKTYSLAEVTGMVLPPDLNDPEGWLARYLRAGKIGGYKVGRTWRMTHQDVEDLITSNRTRPDTAPVADENRRGPSRRSRMLRVP